MSRANLVRKALQSDNDKQIKRLEAKIKAAQKNVSKLEADRIRLERDMSKVNRETDKTKLLIDDLSKSLTSFLQRNFSPGSGRN